MTDPLFLDYLVLSSPLGFLDGLALTTHTPPSYSEYVNPSEANTPQPPETEAVGSG
ncbi:hypothetical protein KIPB_014515, partial [Kipferlia bialata]|eukprot:g14515.t1